MTATRLSPRRATLGLAAVVLGVCALAPSTAHAQNLLTNGSFELGNFTGINQNGQAGSTQLFPTAPTSTYITGWTVVNAEMAWLQNDNPYGVTISNGIRTLDLTGYHDSAPYSGVSQSFATTAGAIYNLSFDIGAFAGNTSGITATVGSVSQNFLFQASSAGAGYQYGTQSLNFTAGPGASTLLTLTGSSTTRDNLGLDNVSVTLVSGGAAAAPEPGTMALLLAAGVLVVGLVRRRRKAPATA